MTVASFWAIAAAAFAIAAGMLLSNVSEKRRALRHMRGREPLSPSAFSAHYFQGPAVPIAEKLVAVLARHLPVDLSRLHPDDLLLEELRMAGLDSFSTVEFVMDVEAEFGVTISDDLAGQWYTFRQIVEHLSSVRLTASRVNDS